MELRGPGTRSPPAALTAMAAEFHDLIEPMGHLALSRRADPGCDVRSWRDEPLDGTSGT